MQDLANAAIAQGQFRMFAVYCHRVALHTKDDEGRSDPVQKEHFELLDFSARTLCAITEDSELPCGAEDIKTIDRLAHDARPLHNSSDSVTDTYDTAKAKGKQAVKGWRPNESTTTDPVEHANLIDYNNCLRWVLQGMQLHLRRSYVEALEKHHMIAAHSEGKLHLKVLRNLLAFVSIKSQEQ